MLTRQQPQRTNRLSQPPHTTNNSVTGIKPPSIKGDSETTSHQRRTATSGQQPIQTAVVVNLPDTGNHEIKPGSHRGSPRMLTRQQPQRANRLSCQPPGTADGGVGVVKPSRIEGDRETTNDQRRATPAG